MGFTFRSLLRFVLGVENFSAGVIIGVLKLAGVTGTSRSSVLEGVTSTGVASSSRLGQHCGSFLTRLSLCLWFRPSYTSSGLGTRVESVPCRGICSKGGF